MKHRQLGVASLIQFKDEVVIHKGIKGPGVRFNTGGSLDAKIQAIPLEIAEAAIDVDKIEDLELVRKILLER